MQVLALMIHTSCFWSEVSWDFLPLTLSPGMKLAGFRERHWGRRCQVLSVLLTCPIPKASAVCQVLFHHLRAWVTTLAIFLHIVYCDRIWPILFFSTELLCQVNLHQRENCIKYKVLWILYLGTFFQSGDASQWQVRAAKM